MMSVPMATWTVTGMSSRAQAHSRLTGAHGGLRALEMGDDGLPEAHAAADAGGDGVVQLASGFLGHAELAGAERGVDVFGRRPRQRDFEIVDQSRAVQRDRRDESALHQIDDDGREARLDDVRAEAPDDAAARRA